MGDLDAPRLFNSSSSTTTSQVGLIKHEFSNATIILNTSVTVPEGWQICTHPQGWIYFFNPTLRVVIDHDIRNPEVYASIMKDTDRPYALADSTEMHFFAQGHRINSTEQTSTNFILFVDHSRCIAYYEDETEFVAQKTTELDPIRAIRRARLYWNYVWNHPVHITTPERAATEALDALTWFYTDNLISSHKSTVPFSKSECEDLMRIVHQLSDATYGHSPSRTVFLAWILRESYKYRDAEQHGRHTAKYFQSYQRSKLPQPDPIPVLSTTGSLCQFLLIRGLFFGIPNTYFLHVKLTSEYRGRLANVQGNWEKYVDRLVREYSHFLLISTVLLSYGICFSMLDSRLSHKISATVGFLSAQDLPELSILFSVVSALTSLGSIIIGVFSMWSHQAKTQKGNFFAYLHNAKHSYFGILGYAIILSLPAVLLVWAIVTFTVALVTYIMQGGIQNPQLLTRISAWAILGVMCILLIAVVSALYTFSTVWKFRQRTQTFFHRIKDSWGACLYA